MNILDNLFGLWWVALTSGAAAVTVAVWGWRGPHSTRPARMMLAVAMVALSVSYWWQIVLDGGALAIDGPAQLRRAAGIVWYPAMVWTALAGIRQSQRQHVDLDAILDQHRPGGAG